MVQDHYHLPVMTEEVWKFLVTSGEGVYVDATLGGGGHSAMLLEKDPSLSVIGIDRDENAISAASGRLAAYGGRVRVVHGDFGAVAALLRSIGVPQVNGILADLGVSSRQLDDRSRGFSFESAELDMRMDRRMPRTAADLVNTLDSEALADIFYRYGEERASRPIARRIVEERRKGAIVSGMQLARLVASVKHGCGPRNPATQVFQALRIAVNEELEQLEHLLAALPDILLPRGRAVIISYHSLEDRLVKNRFRELDRGGEGSNLTKKVIFASDSEVRDNPRARSARLRALERP